MSEGIEAVLQTTDFIHLRSAPSTNAPILARLYQGTPVTWRPETAIQADGYEWVQIRYNLPGQGAGGRGWMARVWADQFLPADGKPTAPLAKPASSGKWRAPVQGYYTLTNWHNVRGHIGVDLAGVQGLPIVAATNGVAVHHNATAIWGYGNMVLIQYPHPTGKGYLLALYAHLRDPSPVRLGQSVYAGMVIGHLGNTGNSSGPHLHLECRVSPVENARFFDCTTVDPMQFFSL